MPITEEEVAAAMRDWVDASNGLATSSNHDERLRTFEANGRGFGYRTVAPRGPMSREEFGMAMDRWRGSLDRYRMELESLEPAVAGEVGLASGFYIEDFQHKGQPPERVRVRFTQAMVRDADGWRVIQFHRDIQPFDDNGQYPRSLTRVEPKA